MSTVVVQARVAFISAVARVAAIARLHRLPKGSWSPGIRIPFFLKREKTRIFHRTARCSPPARALRFSGSMPRSGCFQLARSQAHRVLRVRRKWRR